MEVDDISEDKILNNLIEGKEEYGIRILKVNDKELKGIIHNNHIYIEYLKGLHLINELNFYNILNNKEKICKKNI